MWKVGVDVGGTFTDVFALETSSGRLVSHKVPSTPRDPSEAIGNALAMLRDRFGVDVSTLTEFAHGTTVATNALIQRRGGRIALVTTAGFRDLLTIGRQVRPFIYDLQADYPDPLVPVERRIEVDERIGARGEKLSILTDDKVEAVVKAVSALAPDGVAVCLLFSFLNDEHERRLAEALQRRFPELHVSTSHEVQPVFREYERFSTTVLNTYLQPVMGGYLEAMTKIVGDAAPNAEIGINQSSGGLMSAGQASRFPIRTALSGPAAGVVGAIDAAGRSGFSTLITLDVGGTSTDVCHVRDGSVPLSGSRHVAGFPIRLPSVDVNAVGAGGGSLAEVGPDGLMTVGPLSAGTDPGPACYGRGGTRPTVTDANLVLGRLPEKIAGGDMTLDLGAARRALEPLAGAFDVGVEQAAVGALRIVCSNIVRAIRAVSVERGHDPRSAVLVPYGGAGGLHAIEVAEALGLSQVLVPPGPGILCARGLMVADRSEVFTATRRSSLDGDLSRLAELCDGLRTEAGVWLSSHDAEGEVGATADMRFVGQNYEIAVPFAVTSTWDDDDVQELKGAFLTEHEKAYGHADASMPMEIISLRLTARVKAAPLDIEGGQAVAGTGPSGVRQVWFTESGPHETVIVERGEVRTGERLVGPAVIEQPDSTTLLWPDWYAVQDEQGNLLLEKCE